MFCGIKLKTMSVGRKLETSAKWILGNFTLGKNCAADILATCTTMEHRWGKRKHEKKRKTLEKSWTLSSGQYPPTSLITKKSKLCVEHQKEMSTEIKTNCDKHRLWHHCSRGNKQLKRCFGLAVHFGILDYLFLSVCASNSSTSDLLPIVLHFLNGKNLFQKRYNHQKEILA